MKYLKLLAMALMLIFAVAPQSSSAHSPKLVDELSKISVRFADLDKYKQYENQVLPDGVKVKDRIEALKVVKHMINGREGAQRPSTMNLSSEQKTAIEEIFRCSRINVIKKETKGKKFGSIAELQKFVKVLYDN